MIATMISPAIFLSLLPAIFASPVEVRKRNVCDELPWLKNLPPGEVVSVPGLVVNGVNVDGSDCRAPTVTSTGVGQFIIGNTPVVTPPPAPGPQLGCPYGLRGVVMNGGYNPAQFDIIGVADSWLNFGLTINAPASFKATAGHIPMMTFASDVPAALAMLNGPNPPPYMLTFNEPDYSYENKTPLMTPQEAAQAFAPIKANYTLKTTKLIAPCPADPTSTWLEEFFAACNCKDMFYAYSMHTFLNDLTATYQNINNFHAKWADKPLWITEMAPGFAQCSLGWNVVGQFMNKVYSWAHNGAPYIERIFWNTANQVTNGDTNICNSYLVNAADNTPSPLLPVFQQMQCSGPFV